MIRVLLVDDEEPARDRLRRLLEGFEDVTIVGEAVDGADALDRVAELKPDAVFLDIQMPGRTGLEVAQALTPPRPEIVFCTAFDQYAIDAFELHAVDYLLKPAGKKRLDKALGRLRTKLDDAREVAQAGEAQAMLLPRDQPNLEHLDYAGSCRPAKGVGGDYYDFLTLAPGTVGLVVADVAGKGMYAGLLQASLQARLQELAQKHATDLATTIAEANSSLHGSISANRYVTLTYASFDDARRTLTYVNAGHLPTLILKQEGSTAVTGSCAGAATAAATLRRLEANGTVVGLLPGCTYCQAEIALEPGDLLVMYSDGVTEALNRAGEEFGESRLVESLRRAAIGGADAATIRDRVLTEIDAFAEGTTPHDDVTILVGRVR